MLFVRVINLCTTALVALAPYCKADGAESHSVSQSESTEEKATGSLVKFIKEDASSAALIKEIADELKKEESDIGSERKKALRWGDNTNEYAYNAKPGNPLSMTTTTKRPQPYATDKTRVTPPVLGNFGDHHQNNLQNQNLHQNDLQNQNLQNHNAEQIYIDNIVNPDSQYQITPKTNDVIDVDNIFHVENDHQKNLQTQNLVQTYVENILAKQNVPVLILHVSLTGTQHDKTVTFPINVNLNRPENPWQGWHFNPNQNQGSARPRPVHLRTSLDSDSQNSDIEIAQAIKEKINKSKPGRLLPELEKKNETI